MFDFLKNFQNMRLGDATMFAPKGEGGWQTGVQAEGSAISTTPEGAFAGFNPKVSDLGQAMQAASAQMPGGTTSLGRPIGTGAGDLGRILSTSPPPGQQGSTEVSQAPGAFAAPKGPLTRPPSQQPKAASWLAPFQT